MSLGTNQLIYSSYVILCSTRLRRNLQPRFLRRRSFIILILFARIICSRSPSDTDYTLAAITPMHQHTTAYAHTRAACRNYTCSNVDPVYTRDEKQQRHADHGCSEHADARARTPLDTRGDLQVLMSLYRFNRGVLDSRRYVLDTLRRKKGSGKKH